MKKYSNTTLISYTKDTLIRMIRCLENNIEAANERNNNQFQILMQKDLEREKYKWHDLKKDPTDLPNDEEKVLTYIEDEFGGKIFKHYKILYFSEDLYRTDNYDFIVYQGCKAKGFYYVDSEYGYIEEEPLAWKYIEPFRRVE